jgi:hypothetical protein
MTTVALRAIWVRRSCEVATPAMNEVLAESSSRPTDSSNASWLVLPSHLALAKLMAKPIAKA